MEIGVIDYGVGNLSSIVNMINKVGGIARVIKSPNEINNLEKIILPGVGHFGEGMRSIKNSGFYESLIERAGNTSAFTMGICLGMQLLCQHSEEGDIQGLGLVDAKVVKFRISGNISIKVPHMGWNTVRAVRVNPLFDMTEEEQRFYFVHSYKVVPNLKSISIGDCDYGGEFCAAFQQRNVFGVQFHPEKSHRFGMNLMKRFVDL